MNKLICIVLLILTSASLTFGDDDFRKKYTETFQQMREFHQGLYIKEAMERTGALGLGLSGDLSSARVLYP